MYSVKEIAKMYNKTPGAIYAWIRAGLKTHKSDSYKYKYVGKGKIRIDKEDVNIFLKKRYKKRYGIYGED